MTTSCALVQWTAPNIEEARHIVALLLKGKMVACAQLMPIESHFVWKDVLTTSQEVLVLLKTKTERFSEVKALIESHASYEVPEILLIQIDNGNASYLQWIDEIIPNLENNLQFDRAKTTQIDDRK